MRYPTGNTGTKEEFNRDWYSAQAFGVVTTYGRHEGEDINLRTGGSTDLNAEIKAIAPGIITYYHRASHPTTGYGRHIVQKIVGAWGTRWVHYCHLTDQDFLGGVQNVSEGQIIGRLGNSGTTAPHLHFSIFKVDPVTLINKIDAIAHNETELNQYWDNPFNFINNNQTPIVIPPVEDIRIRLLNEAGIDDESKVRMAIDRYQYWDQMIQDHANLQTKYNDLKGRVRTAVINAIDSIS